MPRKSKKQTLEELHAEAMKQYDESESFSHDERELSRDDIAFAVVSGEQWDRRYRRNKKRPRFEINKIHHSINQVIGEFVQNQITVKVRPAGNNATRETAETMGGLVRNILNCSNFDDIRKNTAKEVFTGGYGAWRVCTEYLDPESFDQDIRLKWIPDALASVFFDPHDKDPLKRNSRYCFVIEDMDSKQFKEEYPNSPLASMDDRPLADRIRQRGWMTENSVRIAEYFIKKPVKKKLYLLSTGESVLADDVAEILDEMAAQGIEIVNERMTDHFDIEWYKLSGAEVLEGPIKWPGVRFLPVIPTYGYNYWIDGRHHFHGMVRMAKDPQRIYNYSTSAVVEAAAKVPKDMIFVTPRQVGEHKTQYQNFNQTGSPFLFYNPDEQAPPPFKLDPPQVQQALMAQAAQADADLQATIGRSATALGDANFTPGSTPSGRAIGQVQQASNLGQTELFDNLASAVEATGDVLLDIIPRVIDTERQIRIIQPDGKDDFATVNQEVIDIQSGQKFIYNDLNAGKYDFVVTTGANFQTQRAENLNIITQLSSANPEYANLFSDLIMQQIESPIADEFEKRARKMLLQQGLVEPQTEEEIAQAEAAQQAQQAQVERQMAIEDATIQNQLKQGEALVMQANQSVVNDNITNQAKLVEIERTRAEINEKLQKAVSDSAETGAPVPIESLIAQSENLRLMIERMDNAITENAMAQQQLMDEKLMQIQQLMNQQSEFLVDDAGNLYNPDGSPVQ